ncbi:serine/threonine-protein kinase [Geodermatophilus marinus]|uniref:hypothetical protein n=1 Tax=Geodermatophilus sp. LHW52908 TaxID=2303986 RepID=UPI000E3B798D|nr:hypothetical protein [Geodermatophilus sp. LHW52908]RFU19094.1 hypothetical protein D0Z06_23175 [Geodermatophilus sp. LHW52908]
MTDLAAGRTSEGHEPSGVPRPREPRPAEPPSTRPAGPEPRPRGGAELTRLIALARLTPAQAVAIGADVLTDAARRPEPGPGSDRTRIGPVVIGADGRVVPAAAADGAPTGGPAAAGPTGPPVAAVLADVAGAARLHARRTGPADPLLAELDRVVTQLPAVGVPAAARMLREATAAVDRTAVSAELAALVRAVGGDGRPAGGTGRAGHPATAGATGRALPARPAVAGRGRAAGRRVGGWLLSVLVLAAVVLGEVALLRDRIATDIDLLLDAGRDEDPAAAPSTPGGPSIAAVAPAAAGGVTAVDLRPLAPCAPGGSCTLRVLVRLVPRADPQPVSWSYRVVDPCTGTAETVPGGTVTVPAAGDRVPAVGTVALPDLPAVAVVAVTDVPAVAASQPVVVGTCPSHQ